MKKPPSNVQQYQGDLIDGLIDTVVRLKTRANDLKLIDRECKNCNKIYNGTAYGLCSHCGRFQPLEAEKQADRPSLVKQQSTNQYSYDDNNYDKQGAD